MIIADTSVWIEFLKGNRPFLQDLGALLEENQILALEGIFAELLQGAKGKWERTAIEEYWFNLPKIDEGGMYLKAGRESGIHKWFAKGIGLIDSFIITAARKTGSPIWTLDKKMLQILDPKEIFK